MTPQDEKALEEHPGKVWNRSPELDAAAQLTITQRMAAIEVLIAEVLSEDVTITAADLCLCEARDEDGTVRWWVEKRTRDDPS